MNDYTPTEFGRLEYPMEEKFYPEAIRFGIEKREGISINNLAENISGSWSAQQQIIKETNQIADWAVAALENGMSSEDTVEQITDEHGNMYNERHIYYGLKTTALGVDNSVKKMKEIMQNEWTAKGFAGTIPESDLENVQGLISAYMQGLGKSFNELKERNTTTHPLGSIYLNMPSAIQFNETANWGGEQLGVAGNLAKGGMTGTSNTTEAFGGMVAGNAGNILAAGVGTVAGAVLGKLGIGSALIGGVLGAFGGESLQKGAEAALSLTQNPYMEMMFSGIGFRGFKFDFVFHPQSEKEIVDVGQIIKMFREHSRPTFIGGSLGKAFMNYPQEFHIEFLAKKNPNAPGDTWETNQHLPMLKPCVCSSVDTNFTPHGIWSSFEKGAPVSITLGLSFQEKELVMAGDVADDWPNSNNPGGRRTSSSNDSQPSTIVVPS